MKYVTICVIWVAVAAVAWFNPFVSMALAFCAMFITDEVLKS